MTKMKKTILVFLIASAASFLIISYRTELWRFINTRGGKTNVLAMLRIRPDQIDYITLDSSKATKITDREEIEQIVRAMRSMEYMNGVSMWSKMTFHLKNGKTRAVEIRCEHPRPQLHKAGEVSIAVNGYMDEYSSEELYSIMGKYFPVSKPMKSFIKGPFIRYRHGVIPVGPSPYGDNDPDRNVLNKLGIEPSEVEKITILLNNQDKEVRREDMDLMIADMQVMQKADIKNGVPLRSKIIFHLKSGETKSVDMDWDYPHGSQPGEITIRIDEDSINEYFSRILYLILEKYLPSPKKSVPEHPTNNAASMHEPRSAPDR